MIAVEDRRDTDLLEVLGDEFRLPRNSLVLQQDKIDRPGAEAAQLVKGVIDDNQRLRTECRGDGAKAAIRQRFGKAR